MNMPRAFDAFVAPARARPQIWRLVLGCVVLVLVTALWMMGSFAAIWLGTDADTAMGTMAAMVQPATPRATLLLLSTFIGMALANSLPPCQFQKLLYPMRYMPNHILLLKDNL